MITFINAIEITVMMAMIGLSATIICLGVVAVGIDGYRGLQKFSKKYLHH